MQIDQMIMIIQIYVHHMTGREVVITPDLPRETPLFLKAYDVSKNWYKKHVINSKRAA